MTQRRCSVQRLLFGVSMLVLAAWVRPAVPTRARPVSSRGAQLDYMVLKVNGERRVVYNGEELAVVRGDTIELQDGALRQGQTKPRELNVVGFKAPGAAIVGDDRGVAFDTDKDLNVSWSEAQHGELFTILATTKGALHGAIYLRLLDPVLRYAELLVNGKTVVLRDGEALSVSAQDQVKVAKVVTNLQSTADVVMQMLPLQPLPTTLPGKAAAGDAPSGGDYQIRFLRGDRPFAAIPVKVKG